MFENIVETAPGNKSSADSQARSAASDGMPLYTVTVHSRPWTDDDDETERSGKDLNYGGPPWVVTFDGFITDEECERLIQLGYDAGYKRSEDVGANTLFDGSFDSTKSTRRTSENAWCTDKSGCRDDEVVQRIMNRIGNVTGIPSYHSEDFQILKYEVGEFYRAHHDYIPHQKTRQCGPRILTFFLYLSDVEGGGGTRFTSLDPPLTVQPRKGRALLWSSVMNQDPSNSDQRTRHEALPVEKGTKFAANAWIHLYDYANPQSKGCN
jgi:prolyl 4-hydroxylase